MVLGEVAIVDKSSSPFLPSVEKGSQDAPWDSLSMWERLDGCRDAHRKGPTAHAREAVENIDK